MSAWPDCSNDAACILHFLGEEALLDDLSSHIDVSLGDRFDLLRMRSRLESNADDF